MDLLYLDIRGIQQKYQTSRLHGMSNNNDYISLGVYQWSFRIRQSFYNYDPLFNIKPSTLVLSAAGDHVRIFLYHAIEHIVLPSGTSTIVDVSSSARRHLPLCLTYTA